jgi:hypothetical protein
LKYFHDSSTARHTGIDRTEARLSQNYYWPHIRKIVADYIRACPVCEKFKSIRENTTAELQPIISYYALDLLVIDFIGPLPTTRKQNRFILSIVDHFSKYAIAMPTARQDSKTVIECLTQYCSIFGRPKRILSDQGKCFVSHEFQEWCKYWNITKATSTSYHPQTQGICERYNQTIMGILKKYAYECPETWCETLPLAVFAYNSSIQDTIAITPFEVMFGRKAKSFGETFNSPSQEPQVSAYVAGLRRTMKTIHEKIVPRQEEARQKMAERYNSKAAGDCFKVGDQVRLYNIAVKVGDSRKFHPYYDGPFIITEQKGVNCKITPMDKTKLKEQWVHQNRLSRSYSKFRKEVTPSPQQEERNNNNSTDSDSSDEEIWVRRQPSRTVHNVPTATPAVRATEPKAGPAPVLAAPQPARSPPKEPPAIPKPTVPVNKTRDKTYYPQRKIPELPRRQNPPRDRRPPQRYSDSVFEVNCITIDTEISHSIKTENEKRKERRGIQGSTTPETSYASKSHNNRLTHQH